MSPDHDIADLRWYVDLPCFSLFGHPGGGEEEGGRCWGGKVLGRHGGLGGGRMEPSAIEQYRAHAGSGSDFGSHTVRVLLAPVTDGAAL